MRVSLNVYLKPNVNPKLAVRDLIRAVPGCTRVTHVFPDMDASDELYLLVICDVTVDTKDAAIEYLKGRDDVDDVEPSAVRRAL